MQAMRFNNKTTKNSTKGELFLSRLSKIILKTAGGKYGPGSL